MNSVKYEFEETVSTKQINVQGAKPFVVVGRVPSADPVTSRVQKALDLALSQGWMPA
jgi:hypothetical protein